MNLRKAIAIATFCVCVLQGCGQSKHASKFYVFTPPESAVAFTSDLAKITQRHGLTPNPGQATDDRGNTLYVLEAKSRWLRLWVQNQPLSGFEPKEECGDYSEPHPDPGQYVVRLDRRFPMIADNEPRRLLEIIGNELKASGYSVEQEPKTCSLLSKGTSSRK
jgi:hypothetical protein